MPSPSGDSELPGGAAPLPFPGQFAHGLRRAAELLEDDPAAAAGIAAELALRDRHSAATFALAALARYRAGQVDRHVLVLRERALTLAGSSPDTATRRWITQLSTALELTRDAAVATSRAAMWLAAGEGTPLSDPLGEDFAWLSYLADGDCTDVLLATGGGPDLPQVHRVARVAWFGVLAASASSAVTAVGWARHAQRQAATIAADLGRPLRAGYAHLAWAHARVFTEPREAAGWAVTAAGLFGAANDPLNAGRAHLTAAVALARAGRPDWAGAERAHARTLLDAHSPELVPLLLRRAGRGSEPTGSRRGSSPTRRERAVLSLLADGLTAAAIARRLSISPRTVHHHLENLYRKLGTTDRLATVLHAEAIGLL